MGSFSIWHWLIIPVLLVGFCAAVIWLLARASRPNAKSAPASRLEELAKLRRQGLLTEDEYQRKRSELVERL
jgi:uncharacterized membrane protein